jgi:hypothetical protein
MVFTRICRSCCTSTADRILAPSTRNVRRRDKMMRTGQRVFVAGLNRSESF